MFLEKFIRQHFSRGISSHLVEEPCGEYHLKQIVDYQGIFELEWFPVLHELRPEYFDNVHISETDEQRGEGWAHQ